MHILQWTYHLIYSLAYSPRCNVCYGHLEEQKRKIAPGENWLMKILKRCIVSI